MLPINPDKSTYYSICQLLDNKDFIVVREFLKKNLESYRISNDTAAAPGIFWNQGACQVLRNLIHIFEKAHVDIRKLDKLEAYYP